jgi:hypothetical protein
VGISVYPPIVAKQWLGKKVPAAKKFWGVILYAIPVVLKESRRLVLPRTFCIETYSVSLRKKIVSFSSIRIDIP